MFRSGVRVLGDVRRLIDRKIIDALADTPTLRSAEVFNYLALPDGATAQSVGGVGIEDMGSAHTTLTHVGKDIKAFDVSVRMPDGALEVLQYEIGEGLVDASVLDAVLSKLDSKRPRAPSPRSREIPGAAEAIDCPTADRCTMERAFRDKLLSNPGALAKQARVIPSQRDGAVQGMKLYGIRRGGLLGLLGLQNGDMITKVDNVELTSPDRAMELMAQLKRAKKIKLTITRRGSEITKTIEFK